jgi:two-component system, cell cycle sensor histidine kinase and response regulator CckA
MKLPAYSGERQPPQESRRPRKTVLVVEDEAFVRESTCEILQNAGYRVLQAGTAAEAKAVFSNANAPVDLLLCDAVLPDENGIALADVLRWQAPGLRTIMASGYPRSVLWEEFKVSNLRQVLSKPYSARLLLAQVEAALRAA